MKERKIDEPLQEGPAAAEYLVDDEFDGSRLDRFVRALLPGISFPAAQSLIRKKRVLLNGKKASGTARLARGDSVKVMAGDLLPGNTTSGGPPPGGESRPVPGPGKGPSARDRSEAKAKEEGRAWKDGMPPPRESQEKLLGVFGRIGEKIAILFEDDDLLVIDKPSGLVVQPGNDRSRGSLLDLLEEYRRRTLAEMPRSDRRKEMTRQREKARTRGTAGAPPAFRYTPVHRLDRGTSGALAIAKTRKAARTLSAFFRSGRVEKVYLAVVDGLPPTKSGVIDSPIKTAKGSRSSSYAAGKGKPSVTRFRLSKQLPGGRSLLEIVLETGRTHQIRVHLASIGVPVAGDWQYGKGAAGTGRRVTGKGAAGRISRLMLHSRRLVFEHPSGRGQVEVSAPVPPDFLL